jgi:hypothetical protein
MRKKRINTATVAHNAKFYKRPPGTEGPVQRPGSAAKLLLKLKDADAMAKEIDRLIGCRQLNSRSKLADIRLDYGQPHEYEWSG